MLNPHIAKGSQDVTFLIRQVPSHPLTPHPPTLRTDPILLKQVEL